MSVTPAYPQYLNRSAGHSLPAYLRFLFLALVTVGVTYFAPPAVASGWYVILLVMYLRSDDEGLWLALFFVTTDGFLGFLGLYSALLKILPGLPGVEVAQLYILLSLAKCIYKRRTTTVFYSGWLWLLFGYALFLVLMGLIVGLNSELNLYFKIIKSLLPLLLFYTLPRLLQTDRDYEQLFQCLFITATLAFGAQLVTLFTGFDPKLAYGKPADTDMEMHIEVGRNFRVLYNSSITLISLFGALYYLALKKKSVFSRSTLYWIVVAAFSMAFLSATRGWILSFGLVILFFFVFIQRLNPRQVFVISALFVLFISIGLSNNRVSRQIGFTMDRLFTLNALASGDITANGTLIRLNERGPRVMKVWRESPVFGLGFSNRFLSFEDGHVANQNILMHAGVVGLALLLLFFISFSWRLMLAQKREGGTSPYSACFPVFVLFLAGWFLLHSTSGQQFAFYGLPNDIFPQAIFFSLAAHSVLEHQKSLNFRNAGTDRSNLLS